MASRFLVASLGILGVDEAVTVLVARSVTSGHLPYLSAADHRGPLLYLFYALPLMAHPGATGSLSDITAVRLFFSLWIAAAALLPTLIVRRWLPSGPAIVASITYAMLQWVGVYHSAGIHSEDFWSAQPEFLLNGFALGAVYLLTRGYGGTVAGVLMGCSVLVKQHAIFELAYGGVLLAWYQGGRKALRFMVGASIPLLAVSAAYAIAGSFWSFYYYFWQYNASAYLPEVTLATKLGAAFQGAGNLFAGPTGGFLLIALTSALPDGSPFDSRPSRKRYILALWGWLGITLAAASLSGRGFAHYYIQLLPPLCMLTSFGASAVSSIVEERAPRLLRMLPAGFAGLCLITTALQWQRHRPLTRSSREFLLFRDEALGVAQAVSSIPGPLFVWGFYPELYLLTERPPASRYLYSSFLTGHGAWMKRPVDIEHTMPLRNQLIGDLEASQPEYIVHATTRGFNHPIEQEPILGAFVQHHYEPVTQEQAQAFPHFLIHKRRAAVAASHE